MTSLRMRVVEAGARELCDLDDTGESGVEYPCDFCRLAAGGAFDRMLDCLTENADEWAEETRVPLVVGGDALALIAALREDR